MDSSYVSNHGEVGVALTSNGLHKLTAGEVAMLPHQSLVQRVLQLQEENESLKLQLEHPPHQHQQQRGIQPAGPVVSTTSQDPVWTETKIRDTAYSLRSAMARGIKSQLKWTASCKAGRARWSYSAGVPNPAVFFRMFRQSSTAKAWKQKKIPVDEFQDIVGHIEKSIRYNALRITGQHVNLRWDEAGSQFTVSGTYGLPQN